MLEKTYTISNEKVMLNYLPDAFANSKTGPHSRLYMLPAKNLLLFDPVHRSTSFKFPRNLLVYNARTVHPGH